MSSKHVLARHFKLTPAALERAAETPQYREFLDVSVPKKKPREIQCPFGLTEALHYRLLEFLDRIERRPYLHSATKKRSSTTNAKAHANGKAIAKLDVKSFYENTSIAHVQEFFSEVLLCSHDLAVLLANLMTVNGHLPTGSAISPLLSYFAHLQMFDEIASLCKERGVTMTLYIDDFTLSGDGASTSLIHDVAKVVRKRGIRTHKYQTFASGQTKIVTGAAIRGSEVLLPNHQHQKITRDIDSVNRITDVDERKKMRKRIVGRLSAAKSVNRNAADKLRARFKIADSI